MLPQHVHLSSVLGYIPPGMHNVTFAPISDINFPSPSTKRKKIMVITSGWDTHVVLLKTLETQGWSWIASTIIKPCGDGEMVKYCKLSMWTVNEHKQ